jgi:hypothetical protein
MLFGASLDINQNRYAGEAVSSLLTVKTLE